MSDLRALLEEAAPAAPPLNLDEIRRRVSRRRRQHRWRAACASAVVAVAAAGLNVVWPRDEAQHVATAVGVLPEHVGDLAASGDGRLFVTGSDDQGHYVAEIEPATGLIAWRVEIPGAPAHRIAYGLGRIWLLRGDVFSVDPDTHDLTRVTDTLGMSAADIGFTDDYAWITDAGHNQLVRAERGLATTTIELSGQPDQVAVSDDGTVWVRLGDAGTVVGLVLDRPTIAVTAPWTGPLLAGSANSAVWSTDGVQLVEVRFDLLSLGQSVALGARVPISDARHVLRREEGLVVATDDRVFLLSGDDVNLATVDAAKAIPAPSGTIRSLAVVDADVWYVNGAGSLVRLPREIGEPSTTRATNQPVATPVPNRIVHVRVHESSVEVEFSHEVPGHLITEADFPDAGECTPVPMPGIDEFVNVVMNVTTEDTPNGLPSGLVAMREGTGLVEQVVLTCAFEGKVHMAIGLSAAASLQSYQSASEEDPSRLVIRLAAAARD